MRHPTLPYILLALAAPAAVASAQQSSAASDPSAACVAAAARGDVAEASRLGATIAKELQDRLALKPDEIPTLIALASVISQCEIPGAELMTQGELSSQAIELLKHALQLRPTEWPARYMLGQIYFRSPQFLGRSADAGRQFDTLLTQQGDQNQPSIFARTFEFRGVLWMRSGQRDSARAVWTRGLKLFPEDSGLIGRMRGLNAAPPKSASNDARPPTVQAVVVHATRLHAPPAFADPHVVQRMDVLMSPGAAADVMQALQLQGGATLVGDGAELHAHGGDSAETPLLLNGSPVIGALRFESFDGALFGVLDPQVLRATQFSPGGFSVSVGNALSGVIEAETDSRPRERHERFGLSSVTASATAKSPMGASAGAWGSVRASNTAAMLWMNGRGDEYTSSPRSIDAIGGLTLAPDGLTEVRFVGLLSSDHVTRDATHSDYSGSYHASGSTGFVGVAARHVSANVPVITKSSVGLSARRSTQAFGVLDRTNTNGIASWHGDAEWRGATNTRIRAGLDAELLAREERGSLPTTAALRPGSPQLNLEQSETSNHTGVWTEAMWERGRTSIVAGIRADRLPGQSNVTVDPRLNATLALGRLLVHGALGVFHQGPWRPSPDQVSPVSLLDIPTMATHEALSIEPSTGTDWRWRVDGFDKQYQNFVQRGGLAVVGGSVQGVDAILRRPAIAGRSVDGWIIYSAARSRVRLQSGDDIPGAFDVGQSVTLVTTWRPSERWSIGTTMRAATGVPTTEVAGSDSVGAGVWLPRYGTPNAARLPMYARSDVRLTRLLPTRRGLGALFVEGINLLNRHNITSWAYDATWRTRTPVTRFFGRRTLVLGVEWQVE